jgi:NAD(P)-dependent dehydrogenase (short-subunit alcohol dehydrogenase family)
LKPLQDRVVLITGAGGAIGRAAATLFAERGAKLACVVRQEPEPSALPPSFLPSGALMLKADVTREDEVRQAVAETVARLGRIDIFVNNAGVEGPQARLADYDAADFMQVLEVNVLGVFLGLKHVMPVMTAQGCGSIINTSSVAGVVGFPGLGAYVASKHAVIGLTRTAALEGARAGVRVNSVNPGPIESRMMQSIENQLQPAAPAAAHNQLAQTVPFGRYGKVEEVARLVAFLASDEAEYITGGVHMVDGGMTAA